MARRQRGARTGNRIKVRIILKVPHLVHTAEPKALRSIPEMPNARRSAALGSACRGRIGARPPAYLSVAEYVRTLPFTSSNSTKPGHLSLVHQHEKRRPNVRMARTDIMAATAGLRPARSERKERNACVPERLRLEEGESAGRLLPPDVLDRRRAAVERAEVVIPARSGKWERCALGRIIRMSQAKHCWRAPSLRQNRRHPAWERTGTLTR